MILILQISLIMKQLISEIVIKAWFRENGFIINQINKDTLSSQIRCSSFTSSIFHKTLQKIVILFKHIVITVEILFILHVANGIHIIIQVYLHEYIYKY